MPTRVEIRCAFGPGSALPAQTLDPAEDLRPRPRRHTVPANEMLVRLSRHPRNFFLFRRVVSKRCSDLRKASRYRKYNGFKLQKI